MATQMLIRHICDNCKAIEDTGGNKSDIKTVPLNLFAEEREIDLCSTCRDGFREEFEELLAASRRPGKGASVTPITKKTRKSTVGKAKIDPVDGEWHCPLCDKTTQSDSGMRLHLNEHHPSHAPDYSVSQTVQARAKNGKRAAKQEGTYPEKDRTCPTCGTVSKTRQALANHVRHAHKTTLTEMGLALPKHVLNG